MKKTYTVQKCSQFHSQHILQVFPVILPPQTSLHLHIAPTSLPVVGFNIFLFLFFFSPFSLSFFIFPFLFSVIWAQVMEDKEDIIVRREMRTEKMERKGGEEEGSRRE